MAGISTRVSVQRMAMGLILFCGGNRQNNIKDKRGGHLSVFIAAKTEE